MRSIGAYEGVHWVVQPTALAVGEPPPPSIAGQRWTVTLTGVAIVDSLGTTSADWARETVLLLPGLTLPILSAVRRYGIPKPPGEEGGVYQSHVQVEQWAPHVALASVFDRHQAVDAGFAVDRWRAAPMATGVDFFTGERFGSIWGGLEVDLAVRDSDAVLHRIAYHITLSGRIRFRRAHTTVAE